MAEQSFFDEGIDVWPDDAQPVPLTERFSRGTGTGTSQYESELTVGSSQMTEDEELKEALRVSKEDATRRRQQRSAQIPTPYSSTGTSGATTISQTKHARFDLKALYNQYKTQFVSLDEKEEPEKYSHGLLLLIYLDHKISNTSEKPFNIFKKSVIDYFSNDDSIFKKKEQDGNIDYEDYYGVMCVTDTMEYIKRIIGGLKPYSLDFEYISFFNDKEISSDKSVFLFLLNEFMNIKSTISMLYSRYEYDFFNNNYKKHTNQAEIERAKDLFIIHQFLRYLNHLNLDFKIILEFTFATDYNIFIRYFMSDLIDTNIDSKEIIISKALPKTNSKESKNNILKKIQQLTIDHLQRMIINID